MKKNFCPDVILFVSGLICIVTGIIPDFHLIKGGREVIKIFRLGTPTAATLWRSGF